MNKKLPKNNKPLRIGISGGIGAGKSLISRIFSVLGVPVFNADLEARNLLETDPEMMRAVTSLLGPGAYSDGMPNRQYIAQKVFSDDALREKLNAIVHPAVGRAFDAWMNAHREAPYVLKEAAITFETGIYKQLDATILVTAPEAVRIERVTKRDRTTPDQVRRRMEAQWTDERKRPLSDYIIENDGTSPVIPRVMEIHQEICRKAQQN